MVCPRVLRHYHCLQRLLCVHAMECSGLHHRIRWHPDLFWAVLRLEDHQENQYHQVRGRRYLFRKGCVGCCRLAETDSKELDREDLVLDCVGVVWSYIWFSVLLLMWFLVVAVVELKVSL